MKRLFYFTISLLLAACTGKVPEQGALILGQVLEEYLATAD